ncbi:hypothetical protein J5U23_02202 [Saccharolobus shibatae B12]|uniref:Uncharacterized protein n=1 Tax=Saccharolobus shibatae (strain ATCC 51178 / DSM 5389 / JCM 8931 / NBRC 15437 / B12) TaxID=523848 RepID=A0A8F5BQA6_SACSH|nr:hypothetical protein J5U23_02202 [Saccharolobus shibatae B12]
MTYQKLLATARIHGNEAREFLEENSGESMHFYSFDKRPAEDLEQFSRRFCT